MKLIHDYFPLAVIIITVYLSVTFVVGHKLKPKMPEIINPEDLKD